MTYKNGISTHIFFSIYLSILLEQQVTQMYKEVMEKKPKFQFFSVLLGYFISWMLFYNIK